MSSENYLSPHLVSQALGVSESTVKRWVDGGVLPARKTAGGHRKIPREEVLRLARERNWPRANLALLGEAAAPPDPRLLADRLYEALAAGDGPGAREMLAGAHGAGLTAARLGDEVVAPAMERVGHGWEVEELDVYQEHRGTQLCLAGLLALKAALPAPADHARPLALGGGPEGDHYLLANLLVELVLAENGWRVVNVGPNTPLASLRRATAELGPRLVWVSASHLTDAEAFVASFGELYDEAEVAGVAVAVGGRALGPEVLGRLTATHRGGRLRDLEAFVRGLHPAGRRG